MRQPEVSTSLKSLQSKGWVRNGDKTKNGTMARSGNTYELTMTIDMIIAELQKEIKAKQEESLRALKELRGLNV
jgi:predicted transcriptional regulator